MAELPFGKGKRFASDATGFANAIIGGWQVNTNMYVQSGLPFDVGYAGSGSDRDVGPGRPDLIGDASGPKTTGPVVQRHAHRLVRAARSAVRPAGPSATWSATP